MARTALDLTDEERAAMRRYGQERRHARLAHWRGESERALEAALTAGRMLRADHGATRVTVYGSLARGSFGVRSDVDLAAWGIPAERFDEAWSAAERVSRDFELNLLRAEDAPPALLAEIARDGIDVP